MRVQGRVAYSMTAKFSGDASEDGMVPLSLFERITLRTRMHEHMQPDLARIPVT